MIKKLRKFTNMIILCITDDEDIASSIKDRFNDCRELIVVDSSLANIDDMKFDILLIDYDVKNSVEIMNTLRINKPNLPKITILKDMNDKNIVECINASAYSIISSPINFDDLKLSMIMALNQSKRVDKVLLNEGIYYDSYRERFYNQTEPIQFTKYEFQVLKLLLDNHDRIISYDQIKENVWKEKKMSIFTMRNVINKIRKKTYYDIIKNNSSTGYQIDTLR